MKPLMSPQTAFLGDELFSLTLMAVTQRAKLYSDIAGEAEREALRRALQDALQSLTARYEKPVSETDHVGNIEFLSTAISGSHGGALRDSRLRIGTAQKALNLHLKYMWCLGRVQMPPHCPIDSIVLAKIPGCSGVRWTKLDRLSEYEGLIQKAKVAAGNTPLAEWELNLYNSAQRNSSERHHALRMATASEVP